MKNTLLFAFITFLSINAYGQRYYTDDVFDDVVVETDIEYGSNVSVLNYDIEIMGFPELPLYMDTYSPAGDTATDKPVVLLLHTGNFLPYLFEDGITGYNGAATGAKNDSSLVFIAHQLAKRGYFVASLDYRLGWKASATAQEERTKTLLEAYYRSIQDVRTGVRFLRKDVAENGNTWGIDPSKIAVLGQGTGGYITYGVAAVDTPEEVGLPEISDPVTGDSYIDFDKLGDIYATNTAQLCVPNHVGFDSDIQFGMNFGGACGTENWIDENTPPLAGMHVIKDPYAPYGCDGDVIVPTTGEFVIEVDGTNCIINIANNIGINDDLINAHFNDSYTLASEQYDEVDNMFGLSTATDESGPWDWWDMDFWSDVIPFSGGPDVNTGMLDDNPDASKAKSLAYCDTIVNFFCPRAMVAMQIEGFEIFNDPNNNVGAPSGIDQLDQNLINVAPNPSDGEMQLTMSGDEALQVEGIALYTAEGVHINVRYERGSSQLDLGNLAQGIYILQFQTSQGVLNKKLLIK